MKYLYALITFLLQCLNIRIFWPASQFALMTFLYFSLLVIGIMLLADKKNDSVARDLGLGMVFGSVGVVAGIIGLFIYLSFNFPR